MITITDTLPAEVWVINTKRVRQGLGPMRVVPTVRCEAGSLLLFYGKANGAGRESIYTYHESFATLDEANAETLRITRREFLHEQAKFTQIKAKLEAARAIANA
jgi:hypothetical protein